MDKAHVWYSELCSMCENQTFFLSVLPKQEKDAQLTNGNIQRRNNTRFRSFGLQFEKSRIANFARVPQLGRNTSFDVDRAQEPKRVSGGSNQIRGKHSGLWKRRKERKTGKLADFQRTNVRTRPILHDELGKLLPFHL
jgi:hypothetical protein